MKFIDKYWAKTPKKWRKRGDFALVLLVVIQTAIIGAPQEVLSTRQSYWLSLGLTLIVTSYKFWTNTHTEDENTSI